MSPQDVSNVLTALMGLATVWMAHETRKMARAAQESRELEMRPYLSFDSLEIRIGKPAARDASGSAGTVQVGIRLHNPGKVLITYAVRDLRVNADAANSEAPHYENTGSVLHPGQFSTFYCPGIPCKMAPQVGLSGDVSFDIDFWALPSQRHSFKGKLKYSIASMDPPYVPWLWVGWPIYT
jgi:hypothetical protein